MEMDYNMDKLENERLMCRKHNNNSLILQNSNLQMRGTHQEVKMTNDGEDGKRFVFDKLTK